jgi:hypothetical protein
MTAQKRKWIVFAALPIALVWGYYNLMFKPSITAKEPPAFPETAVAAAPSRALAADSIASALTTIKSQTWGADPFRMGARQQVPSYSAPTAKRADMTWQLNGIIYNEDVPFAYVNSRPVKVGDIVNTATVVAIGRTSVTLEVNGNRFTISLRKGASS